MDAPPTHPDGESGGRPEAKGGDLRSTLDALPHPPEGRAIAMGKLMDHTAFDLRDRQTAPLLWGEMARPAALLRAARYDLNRINQW
jgi:hypothetical protein